MFLTFSTDLKQFGFNIVAKKYIQLHHKLTDFLQKTVGICFEHSQLIYSNLFFLMIFTAEICLQCASTCKIHLTFINQFSDVFFHGVVLLSPPSSKEGHLHVDEAFGGITQQLRDHRVQDVLYTRMLNVIPRYKSQHYNSWWLNFHSNIPLTSKFTDHSLRLIKHQQNSLFNKLISTKLNSHNL